MEVQPRRREPRPGLAREELGWVAFVHILGNLWRVSGWELVEPTGARLGHLALLPRQGRGSFVSHVEVVYRVG